MGRRGREKATAFEESQITLVQYLITEKDFLKSPQGFVYCEYNILMYNLL